METSIRRTEPERAIEHGAVGAVGGRRGRPSSREKGFDRELARRAERGEESRDPERTPSEPEPAAPAGEVGSRIDVTA